MKSMLRTGSRQLGKSGRTYIAGVCCDAKMAKYLKGKVYEIMNRPVLMYGAETWTVTRRVEA